MIHFLTRLMLPLLAMAATYAQLPAQSPVKTDLAPCGTPPWTDPWLTDYLERPQDFFFARSNDTLYAGMQIHLLARDNGTGRFPTERLLDAFCRLNLDFSDARVRFFFKYDWNLLNKTAWFDHNELETGIAMMFENNVPDALNIYFVSDPAGNCGYNLPYAGIAMAHGCSGPNDHTWAHEVGHALTLQHTFIGWEGKLYNFNNPTPDTLTYDYTHFHAEPDTILPVPLDTALVEYADASNCYSAADKFCDTPPDYLSYRWDCDSQGKSLVKQKDPDGNEFYSDGSLFMSYANDVCSNRFSEEQIAALRANLLSVKLPWLSPAPVGGPITATPELLAPVNGAEAPAAGALLRWSSAANASHYLVQVSRFPSFAVKELDLVTTDTLVLTNALQAEKTYFWRVRPFNAVETCSGFGPTGQFVTGTLTAAETPAESGWRVYPTLLRPGASIQVETPEHWQNRTIRYRMYGSAGQLLAEGEWFNGPSAHTLTPPAGTPGGSLLHLAFSTPQGAYHTRVVLLR